ncbi:MAG: HAD-IIIA family hydrolase [Bacteroidota bacterium]
MKNKKTQANRLKYIKLLLLDVDGVMTDGGIYYSQSGEESKKFNIQDGYGIVKFHRAGLKTGIITGRVSAIVARRAKELGIEEVHQNLENKLEAYESVKKKLGLSDNEIAYIGDDEFDLPVLDHVAFSAAPADAVDAVRKRVEYVCRRRGGEGAVREVIELILRGRNHGR